MPKETLTKSSKVDFSTVRGVALYLIGNSKGHWTTDLLELLPGETLNAQLTDDNPAQIEEKIDRIRDRYVDELAGMMNLQRGWRTNSRQRAMLTQKLNAELDTLPGDLEEKKKRVTFLISLSMTVARG